MFNLLRGELFKLKKGKNIWVCLIIIVVFVLLLYFILNMVDNMKQIESTKTNISNNLSVGVTVPEGISSVWNEFGIIDVTQQVLGGIGAILTAVFACIFVIGEFNNGSIKNIVGKGYARWKVFAAKYIATVVVAACMLLFMVIVTFIFGVIIVGTGNINASNLYDLSVYAGIEIILGASLTGIMVVVSECTRNLGAGITISMGIIMFSSLLTSGLDLLCHSLQFKPSDYWLMDLIGNCPATGIESEFVVRAVIMSFVWIALSMTLGMVHFQKADIK